MDIIAGAINGKYLRHYVDTSIGKTEYVKAAVAYANSHPELFDVCWKNKIPLTYYGRYDRDVPISPGILETFLKKASGDYLCKLVPDIFHPKVIWWYGFGAYIGSANLTNAAWYGNIELGTFFYQDEMDANGITKELEYFFDFLDSKATLLSDEIYLEQCRLQDKKTTYEKRQKSDNDDFEFKRKLPRLDPLKERTVKSVYKKQKEDFLKEWYSTLQILRNIAAKVSADANRPDWLTETIPQGAQADQFLHAYYYEFVKVKNRSCHHKLHEENKNNKDSALNLGLRWWKRQLKAPHNEDINLIGAKTIADKIGNLSAYPLSEDDFILVCQNIHALMDHSLRVRNSTLGLPEGTYTTQDKRIVMLAKWIYQQKNSQGRTVTDTIKYVLYGGALDMTPDRIFDAYNDDHWMIPHFGINTIGEMVGWALPNNFPPRNGRTSKALYALGYDVKIYSE